MPCGIIYNSQIDFKCKRDCMGNNKEIRGRMETYRIILLVLNWIGSIAFVISGFVLIDYIGQIAAAIIIGAIILGIIGHFLTNVALAIPFILLNNGDILESMRGNTVNASDSNDTGILDASTSHSISQKDEFAQINIKREKTFLGNIFGMDIFIDGKKILTLSESEDKYTQIKYGEHKLSAVIADGSKIYSKNDGINININPSKMYNYKLKEHGKYIEINNG